MLTTSTNIAETKIEIQNNNEFLFNKSLDQKFLQENYSTNLGFAKKMFALFLEGTPPDMSKLSKAVEVLDFPTIKAISHKIKNNFNWVGLSSLGFQLKELEDMANNNADGISNFFALTLESYNTHIAVIKKDYKRLSDHLN